MVHASYPERGRCRALAPAALLLALCLLVGAAQAVTGPTDMAALFTGEGEIDRGAVADTVVPGSPVAISNGADGEPFQVPADPAHVWVAGDVFSLHGVDRYRYIVVYTRDTADGLVHGCYEVDRTDSGDYEVSQYVHGQEVFGDAFIAEQGGRFIENVPLGEVAITDDTPGNDGQSSFGMTLGSIFGAANAPVPTETPGAVPTAKQWPTQVPAAAPTGVVSVTFTPGPTPSLPSNPQPYPMPTVSTTPVLPVETVMTAPDVAPVLEPATLEPAVTSEPTPVRGKRFATWQAPSTTGRRVSAAVTPEATVTTGSRAVRPTRTFGRIYPPWSPFARSTTGSA